MLIRRKEVSLSLIAFRALYTRVASQLFSSSMGTKDQLLFNSIILGIIVDSWMLGLSDIVTKGKGNLLSVNSSVTTKGCTTSSGALTSMGSLTMKGVYSLGTSFDMGAARGTCLVSTIE